MGQDSSRQSNTSAAAPPPDLTPADAAREYLQLLSRLSQDFTSPEGQTSRVISADGEVLNDAYEGDKHFIARLLDAAQVSSARTRDAYLDQALSLKIVDSILEAEQEIRLTQRDFHTATVESTAALSALKEFERSSGARPLWRRILSHGQTRRQQRHLRTGLELAELSKQNAASAVARAQIFLENYLESAYSPDYYCCHHILSPEHLSDHSYKDRVDHKYHQRFFCAERSAAIDRALALRQQFCLY